MVWYQLLGWLGVVAILCAYGAVTLELLLADSLFYLLLNSVGAAALIVQSVMIKNYQLIVLNVVWLGVAAVALGSLLLQ